jgi:hypothetical protein
MAFLKRQDGFWVGPVASFCSRATEGWRDKTKDGVEGCCANCARAGSPRGAIEGAEGALMGSKC